MSSVSHEKNSFDWGRVIGSLAHGLRGPLQTIEGFSLILSEDYSERPLDSEALDFLHRIRADAARMNQQVGALVEAGKVMEKELELEQVDLSALARRVATELSAADPNRRVEWEIAPDLAATADPSLALQLLRHLLDNAWKFSAARELACIQVGRAEVGSEFYYYVRDNGPGFDPRRASRLFLPFSRLHSHAEFPGTGMGLFIVQQIVARHHGTVRAESHRPDGATFWFRLGPGEVS